MPPASTETSARPMPAITYGTRSFLPRGWKFITPLTMYNRIVEATLGPEMSPFSEDDANCPSTCHCRFRWYPPRTPRNRAELVPMLAELTADGRSPHPTAHPRPHD